jgi:hypothetical protein
MGSLGIIGIGWDRPCDNFLYGFKAARRAARTADSAHRLRSRWRSRYGGDKRQSGWREKRKSPGPP